MEAVTAKQEKSHDVDDMFGSYLQDILSDLGIQLSPGGMGIIEIEREPGSEEEQFALFASDSPTDLAESVKFTKRRKKKTSKLGSDVWFDEDSTYMVTSPDSSQKSGEHPAASTDKKPKVYQIEKPFEDEEQERRRLNAILAKRNRDKKKMEMDNLKDEVRKLKYVNNQCSKALKRAHTDVQKFNKQLQEAKERELSLRNEVKEKEREIRGHFDKFVLFRGHLELIISSLDETDPTRKLIATLLKNVPAERRTET